MPVVPEQASLMDSWDSWDHFLHMISLMSPYNSYQSPHFNGVTITSQQGFHIECVRLEITANPVPADKMTEGTKKAEPGSVSGES